VRIVKRLGGSGSSCKDPFCPCQDGDQCHYDDGVYDPKELIPAMKAWKDELIDGYICFGPMKKEYNG